MPDRILVVEDDRALRQVIVGALRDEGYVVEAVPDGIQAAQHLRQAAFQLVLLDLGLPFVDGWEILDQLEGMLLPSVIVISARARSATRFVLSTWAPTTI